MKLKIEEAYRYAVNNGYNLKKKELAKKLFPNASAPEANLINLFSGHTKRVDIDLVVTLCNEFGVCADFLFGLTESPTGQKDVSPEIDALLDTAAQALWQIKSQIKNEKR